MVTKLIGIATFALAIFLYLLSINSPSDLIFYVVSGNIFFAVARLLVATGLLIIIFDKIMLNSRLRVMFVIAGLGLIIFGLLGILTDIGVYTLYDYIKPLDFMTFMQLGTAVCLVGLEKSAKAELSSEIVSTAKLKPSKISRLIRRPITVLRSNSGSKEVKYVLR